MLVPDAVAVPFCLVPTGCSQQLEVLLCFLKPGASLGVRIASQLVAIESDESPALACIGQISGFHPQRFGDLGLEFIIHREVVVPQETAMFSLQTLIDFHDGGNTGEVAIDDVTDGYYEFEILLVEACDTGF